MAARNISTASLTALYEKHGSTLAAYLCCRGVEFASAEDAVQQLFLKLMQAKVSMPEEPLAYLYRAVRNTSFNLRRSTRREVEMNERENWLMEPEGRAEEALSVQAALRDIPQEQREAVFLKIWGGMTLQEISEVLEIPMNTVASRYRYALEKLREKLQPVDERR